MKINSSDVQLLANKLAALSINEKVNYGKPSIRLKDETGEINLSFSNVKDFAKTNSPVKGKKVSDPDEKLVFHLPDSIVLKNPQNQKKTEWKYVTFHSKQLRDTCAIKTSLKSREEIEESALA